MYMYEWSLKWGTRALGPKKGGFTMSADPLEVSDLQLLDRHLRLFVPALFSKIEIMNNEVIVEVPHRVAPKIAKHLQDYYCINTPLEVIGV